MFAPANAYHIDVDGPPTSLVEAGRVRVRCPQVWRSQIRAGLKKKLTAGLLSVIVNINVNVMYPSRAMKMSPRGKFYFYLRVGSRL